MFIDNLVSGMPQDSRYGRELKQSLSAAVRFQVDNVAHYVFENIYGEELNIEKKIPNIAPLAPVMWFEYNGLAAGKDPAECYGLLVSVCYDSSIHPQTHSNFPEDTRWILAIDAYAQNRATDSTGVDIYDWVYFVALNKDGQSTVWTQIPNHTMYPDMPGDPPEILERADHFYVGAAIALTAICFAHCKGAEVKEHQPSRQVRRAAERKDEPVYTYKTIDIGPANRVLSGEGNISQNGLAKALHICRGHFAHYTPEKPLFGKYVGTVYKPMHLRGKAENGVVEKDYRVHTETK